MIPSTLPSSVTPLRQRSNLHPLATATAIPAGQTLAYAKAEESLPSNAEQASKIPHEDSADTSTEVYDTAPFVSLSLAEIITVSQADALPGDSNTSGDIQPNASPSKTDAPSGSEEMLSEPEEPTQIASAPIDNKTPGTLEPDSTLQSSPVLAGFEALESLLASSYSEARPDTAEPEEEPIRTSFENKLPMSAECPIFGGESDPITRVIRTLGPHDAFARHARSRKNETCTTHRPQSTPVPLTLAPEAAAVIDKARRILRDLPGSVVPEE